MSASPDAAPLNPAAAATLFAQAKRRVCAVVRGKDEVVDQALVAAVAGGHLLLEDVPGVGKTTLATALAEALGGALRRVQFTSDLLPGDITGVSVLVPGSNSFTFRRGPLFANVVLADEINRATPKTQSALLEAMSEGQVTVDGQGHALPNPFVVLATQNPHDFHGTFPLPDSQLDRFLMRLSMGYPSREHERSILRSGGRAQGEPDKGLTLDETRALRAAVDQVSMHEEVEDYLLDLVAATRSDARFLRGVSTRGAGALHRAARALALSRGRAFVVPEDLRELAVPVLAHRVLVRSSGEAGAARAAVQEVLWGLPSPA